MWPRVHRKGGLAQKNHTKMFPTQALFLDRGAGHTNLMQAKWPISSAHFPFTFPAEHSWFGQFGTMHLDLAILGLDRDNRLNRWSNVLMLKLHLICL